MTFSRAHSVLSLSLFLPSLPPLTIVFKASRLQTVSRVSPGSLHVKHSSPSSALPSPPAPPPIRTTYGPMARGTSEPTCPTILRRISSNTKSDTQCLLLQRHIALEAVQCVKRANRRCVGIAMISAVMDTHVKEKAHGVVAPSQLHLPQHCVDAKDSGPLLNFRVRDPVLPSQLRYFAEAAVIEVIQLPDLVRLDVPGLRSMNTVTIPHGGFQSAKDLTDFGDTLRDLIVDSRVAWHVESTVFRKEQDMDCGRIDTCWGLHTPNFEKDLRGWLFRDAVSRSSTESLPPTPLALMTWSLQSLSSDASVSKAELGTTDRSGFGHATNIGLKAVEDHASCSAVPSEATFREQLLFWVALETIKKNASDDLPGDVEQRAATGKGVTRSSWFHLRAHQGSMVVANPSCPNRPMTLKVDSRMASLLPHTMDVTAASPDVCSSGCQLLPALFFR
ncbi:unnamed protein product [Schistocephalus solidus]|uniref:Fmp27_GFWDK domain-containing protein n=1 Tax=Schistocephalus solidus TaxID=70667 RepID=A0A183SNN8_SCHSO|nr:unnamed protein product [Schistocephalus solidus]